MFLTMNTISGCVDGALKGDVSSVLMIFNEVLEKGFDGHNFVAGLNSHLRDLLVSKDEVTLEASRSDTICPSEIS